MERIARNVLNAIANSSKFFHTATQFFLKVQYVTLTASGWNGWATAAQILNIVSHTSDSTLTRVARLRTRKKNKRKWQWKETCLTQWVVELIYPHFNIPLVIKPFRWMPKLFRSGRICNFCLPSGNSGCWNTIGQTGSGQNHTDQYKTDIY